MGFGRQRVTVSSVAGRALVLAAAACACTALLLGVTRSSIAAGDADATTRVVLYMAPVRAMFVNNDDDEARGDINNPFGTREGAGPGNGEDEDEDEATGGPFPGDSALYSFTVYTNRGMTAKTGSAVFTCRYAFDKDAFCNASFHLKGSLLFGAGPLDFGASRFALAVTGGSGAYAGASGEVRAAPSGKHGQRLTFVLD
jgi:hypothetical protein